MMETGYQADIGLALPGNAILDKPRYHIACSSSTNLLVTS